MDKHSVSVNISRMMETFVPAIHTCSNLSEKKGPVFAPTLLSPCYTVTDFLCRCFPMIHELYVPKCFQQQLPHSLLGMSNLSTTLHLTISIFLDYWRSSLKENTSDMMMRWKLRCVSANTNPLFLLHGNWMCGILLEQIPHLVWLLHWEIESLCVTPCCKL
jgi:hypothetical protein